MSEDAAQVAGQGGNAMASTINSLGLGLDIIGALLLFKYGLPAKIDPEGHRHLSLGVDQAELARAKRYQAFSRFAALLLFLGFVLQLVSNFVK